MRDILSVVWLCLEDDAEELAISAPWSEKLLMSFMFTKVLHSLLSIFLLLSPTCLRIEFGEVFQSQEIPRGCF